METHVRDEQIPTGWITGLLAVAVLIVGPLAVVATKANPPPKDGWALAAASTEPESAGPPFRNPVPLDAGDIGSFAFGYVEFDWDPRAPGGVPGFDSWPPGSARR